MGSVAGAEVEKSLVEINEDEVRGHLDEVVRQTVEETLNSMLDAEADQLCGAKRYERTVDRLDTRAGSYERNLETKAGKVKLKVPRLRSLPFETQIIERYRRRRAYTTGTTGTALRGHTISKCVVKYTTGTHNF